jgi:short-subunit dehydrogenase
MKVLLTGAFGNIGTSTLEELLQRGHQVRCFDLKTKANEKTARRYGDKIEVMWGDLRNREDVEAAVQGQDVVLHVAFIIPKLSMTGVESEARPDWAREINVGGTRNLIEAMKAQPKPPKLLFTSSLHVYGYTQNQPPPRTVNDPPRPEEHYSRHKVECEEMVKASGLTWTIFRLGAALPVRLVTDPTMFDISLKNRIEFVYTKDVGLAIANALETDEVWGKIWLIGGGPRCQLTQGELVEAVLEAVGIGMLPEEAFSNKPYPTDWLDTTESQRVLKFQRHTLEDYAQSLKAVLGFRRHLIKLFRPIIRAWLLGKSAYLEEARLRQASPEWIGKVAVVTGASTGIGAAIAKLLARRGLRVVLVARRKNLLEQLADEIRADDGEAAIVAADLSNEEECLAVFKQAREIYGPVDVLVNSAGLGWYGFGDEIPWTVARQMIQVNVAALTRLTLLFLQDMKARNSGHIINISSIAGSIPSQGVALYCATKSFVDTLTSGLYRELRGTGVHISVVRPGAVSGTEFFDASAERFNDLSILPRVFGVKVERVANRVWRLLKHPARVAYVPRIMSVVPWLELSFGWLIDALGPLWLKRQARRAQGAV